MKNLILFLVISLSSGCIGPLKELDRQIEDVYFDTGLDDIPMPLPEDFVNKVEVIESWLNEFDSLPDYAELVFKEDSVFFITDDGVFTKLSQDTGNVLFSKKIDLKIKTGLFGGLDNYFFFTDQRNFLTKIDDKGNLIWSIKLTNSLNLSPFFYKNQIIIKFINNKIESFDVDSGLSLWSYERQNPPLSINVQSPIEVANDVLYSGYPGGKVVIIEPESGSFLTELTLSRPKGVTEIDRTNDVAGNLGIVDNLLFASSYNGEITAFDRASGSKIWSRKISSYHGISTDKINLIVAHENDSIYNFDLKSGKTIWKNNDLSFRKIARPLIYKDFLLAIDYLGILHIINLNEGDRLGVHKSGNDLQELIEFGGKTGIHNSLNNAKLYKHEDFVYVLLNRQKIIKIQVNE
jgi:outer membrane protein assembly factor BamB